MSMKLKLMLVFMILGLVMFVPSVKNVIALSKPAVDLYELDDAGFAALKNGQHVAVDVRCVWGQPISVVTQHKVFGVVTSERETSGYFEVPIIYQDSNGEMCWDHSIIIAAGTSQYSMFESQIDKTWNWYDSSMCTYENMPTTIFRADGVLKKFSNDDIDLLMEYNEATGLSLSREETLAYYTPYYIVQDKGQHRTSLILGVIFIFIGLVCLALLIKERRDENFMNAMAPRTAREYYGPQGNDQDDFNAANVSSAFSSSAKVDAASVSAGFATQGGAVTAYGKKEETFTPQTAPTDTPDALKNVNPMFGNQSVAPEIVGSSVDKQTVSNPNPFAQSVGGSMDSYLGGGAPQPVNTLESKTAGLNGNGLQSQIPGGSTSMDPILGSVSQQSAENVFSGNGLSQNYNSVNPYGNDSGRGLYGAPQNQGVPAQGTANSNSFGNTDPFGNKDTFGNTNTFGNGQGGNPV
ncbi:MAG: hypothetical protein K6G19_06570 [Lachnospiraceae bacterium]|nr:hypothetical protein [Lachnospiraceae bacterium]